MPNFDGTGPLQRGWIIRLWPDPCKKCSEGCRYQTNFTGLPVKDEKPL